VEPPNFHDWFDDAEFERCPRCDQRTAVTTPEVGAVVCTECGFVGFRATERGPEE
jgi:transcription initiation factor TFIIIB Brf1 subunit/transcription initiation factor TFIIB